MLIDLDIPVDNFKSCICMLLMPQPPTLDFSRVLTLVVLECGCVAQTVRVGWSHGQVRNWKIHWFEIL